MAWQTAALIHSAADSTDKSIVENHGLVVDASLWLMSRVIDYRHEIHFVESRTKDILSEH
jgi:hypothetical protein